MVLIRSPLLSACQVLLFILTLDRTWGFVDVENIQNLKKLVLKEHTKRVQLAREKCSTGPQNVGHNRKPFGHLLEDELSTYPGFKDVTLNDRSRRSAKGVEVGRALVLTKNHRGSLLLNNSLGDGDESKMESFTVDLWIKPEGGQENPAMIIRALDRCSPFEDEGWSLGISAYDGGEKNPHYFATLQVAQMTSDSVLNSPTTTQENKWTHIALSYDGRKTCLYVNGARVSVNNDQRGAVFRSKEHVGFLQTCRILQLGGGFRGAVANLRLWRIALKQEELRESSLTGLAKTTSDIVLWEDFQNDDKWEWENGQPGPPILIKYSDSKKYGLNPEITKCGLTICDAPEVALSYAANWQLRTQKTLRYQVVNVRNSDGSNATVHPAQIIAQHKALNAVFKPYNISWELSELAIQNTTLRRRTILFGCLPQQVGDGDCNHECSRQGITRNDGGDCDKVKSKCKLDKQGNDICEPECNTVYHNWDGGDCCNPNVTDTTVNCVDPSSSERAYMDVEELKSLLKQPSDEQINVFFALRTNQDISGLATFPWEKHVLTELGGVVIRPEDFGVEGHMDTLIHEIGHALGLWHVHRGISEVGCGDPCLESLPSMTEGDLCEDTRPTLAHSACRDPAGNKLRCGIGPFKATPYRNYMSYADDACTNHFTKQQVARMHCYIDLSYPTWVDQHIQNFRPPAPPLPPTVIDYRKKQLTIAWVAPLNEALYLNDEGSCSKCNAERALVQHGASATALVSSMLMDGWQPHQATGPPDSETCYLSPKSWMADPKYCIIEDADSEGCTLNVTFAVAVVPYSLAIWLSSHARQGLADVSLEFADGTIKSLGPVTSTCDQKFTVVLPQIWPWLSDAGNEKSVTKVMLKTASALVAVDSVQIVSRPNHQACYKCKPLRYRVHREPPFVVNHRVMPFVETEDLEFTDKSVVESTTYRYRVQAFFSNQLSHLSPVTTFRPGQQYCGDNIVQTPEEECDDGNQLNGDGCSTTCKIQDGFHCTGSPSVCFWHRGDGICESFERDSVVEDCGYSTPKGFTDQWASRVESSPDFWGPFCPLNLIVGPPISPPNTCNRESNSSDGWRPCMSNPDDNNNYYFEAFFDKPVVVSAVLIYLKADGGTRLADEEFKRPTDDEAYQNSEALVSVDLIDSDDGLHPIGRNRATCSVNPIIIAVTHDLTRPFYQSQAVRVTFTSADTTFAAIRLRSIKHFNPMEVSRCPEVERKSLYSPELGHCVSYFGCQRPLCKEAPLIKNGKLMCTGVEEGDTCTVRCDEGYFQKANFGTEDKVSDPAALTCIGSKWIGGDLSCRPIDCYLPKIPHADSVCPDGTTLGRNCTFKCRPPARMRLAGVLNGNGNGGMTSVVTCTKEGTWSEAELYCLLTCPVPQTPNHSMSADSGFLKQKHFGFGQSLKFRCKNGFHVAEKSIRSRSFQVKCNSSGFWVGPSCVPVTCSQIDISDGGLLNCTDANRAGSVCNKTCFERNSKRLVGSLKEIPNDDGKNEVNVRYFSSRCGADGEWQSPIGMCGPQGESCSAPQLNISILRFDCFDSVTPVNIKTGSFCKVYCLQSDLEPMINVNTEREVSNLATFGDYQLRCTAQGWNPDPSKIECSPKCVKKYIGDGFCDATNNQEKCRWDGGDCCPSSVKNGKIITFPPDCQQACRCLDPSANKQTLL